jgi:hypothetical protein
MLVKAAENEDEFRAARHRIHHHQDAEGLREMDLPIIFFLEACQADHRVDQFRLASVPWHVCQLASSISHEEQAADASRFGDRATSARHKGMDFGLASQVRSCRCSDAS